MDPSRQTRPQLDLKLATSTAPVFPQALLDELTAAVKGPVLRPTDKEYPERAKTFNGKLKPQVQVLVSPLDAHDVSTVVKFCIKHGLSPSVRAGGYGIAGWAVAGDVVIDMSMIKDIEIEPPQPDAEDGVDWTRLSEMLPPGSKGKGRAQTSSRPAEPPASVPTTDSPGRPTATATTPTAIGKRRREDRSPSVEADEVASTTNIGHFDAASKTIGSFLRGPPLPPITGETPREPPTNRPRLHSPIVERAVPSIPSSIPHTTAAAAYDPVPAFSDRARQISAESAGSDESGSRFSTFASTTTATSIATSPDTEKPGDVAIPTAPPQTFASGVREPFSYLAPGGAPPSIGLAPGSGPGAPLSSSGPGASAIAAFFPPPPEPADAGSGTSAGMAAWNPILGLGMPGGGGGGMGGFGGMGGTGSLPFSLPATVVGSSGPTLPWMSGASPGVVASSGQPFQLGGAFGAPDTFTQALLAAQSASGHLATMPHAKPVHSHAYVTFGAGMRQKEIDLYTADHPLEGVNPVTGEKDVAVPYHVPMSAHPVGSSIMLLAGFGFISRMHGLSIDNVVEVEMVLADGRIIIVNAETDPDLWWAIRGAGPAFGIATRYKARAHPVPVVFAGNLLYRFHRATAASLIKHFRDCIKNAPRELYANVLLTAGPADADSIVVIQMCYAGPKEKGMEYLQAISSWDGERALLVEVNEKTFLSQQDSVAQVLRGRAGRQWFLRSSLITSLPDELITKTVMEFADTPIGCTWIFELAGGAIGDYEDTCLPKEQREALWTVAALHQWDMGVDDPRCVTTAEEWMKGTIKRSSVGGPYPTFLGRHEDPARVMACYGKNWARLAALKRKYDPDGFFKNNFWPLDKDGYPLREPYNEPPSPVFD